MANYKLIKNSKTNIAAGEIVPNYEFEAFPELGTVKVTSGHGVQDWWLTFTPEQKVVIKRGCISINKLLNQKGVAIKDLPDEFEVSEGDKDGTRKNTSTPAAKKELFEITDEMTKTLTPEDISLLKEIFERAEVNKKKLEKKLRKEQLEAELEALKKELEETEEETEE